MSESRKFGFIFSGYFLAVLLLILWRHHSVSIIAWIIFGIAFLCALFVPKVLKPINIIWDGILKVLSYVNTRILFGIIFFIIFTPIAFCKRLMKKDTLQMHYDETLSTYRHDCRNMKIDLRRPY